MAQGLVDADLGGHVLKKRLPLQGRGKRGGARTLVATKLADRWFFLFGFGKNEQATISKTELRALQTLAHDLLGLSDHMLGEQVTKGKLWEVCRD